MAACLGGTKRLGGLVEHSRKQTTIQLVQQSRQRKSLGFTGTDRRYDLQIVLLPRSSSYDGDRQVKGGMSCRADERLCWTLDSVRRNFEQTNSQASKAACASRTMNLSSRRISIPIWPLMSAATGVIQRKIRSQDRLVRPMSVGFPTAACFCCSRPSSHDTKRV